MKRVLKGEMTFSRVMCNMEDDYMEITLSDSISGIEFVSVRLSMEQYGKLISGQSYQKVDYELRGAGNIGKVKESEPAQIALPHDLYHYNKKPVQDWLEANCQREGWYMDTYLGSQGSVVRSGNTDYANIRYYRYVEPQDA